MGELRAELGNTREAGSDAEGKEHGAAWLTDLLFRTVQTPFFYHLRPPANSRCSHRGLGPPTSITHQESSLEFLLQANWIEVFLN